jgi:chromosome segregation ATPase
VVIAALWGSEKRSGNEAESLGRAQESQPAIPHRATNETNQKSADIERGVQDLRQSLADATREMRALRSKVQALEQDGAEARRRLAELADDQSQLARGSDYEWGADASAGGRDPVSREQLEEEIERADAQVWADLEKLDHKARSERRDGKWAETAELQIKDSALADNPSGLTLVAAECRSTLCRIEWAGDASAPAQETLHAVLDGLPWSAGGMAEVADSGEVVLYLAREGHQLSE